MKKLTICLLALAGVGGIAYWSGQQYPNKIAFWKAGPAAVAGKSGPPTTAVVATRNINFAVTAAGYVGDSGWAADASSAFFLGKSRVLGLPDRIYPLFVS
jgi:hypothetical protein